MLQQINERTLNDSIRRYANLSITDVDGKIIYVNDNFCALTGWSRVDLIGNSHKLLSSGHHNKLFWASMWKTLQSGMAWRGDILNAKRNGDLNWFDTTIFPLLESNRIVGYLSFRNDVTALRNDVTNSRQAKDRVIQDSNIKSDFISIAGEVMHESMTGISNMISILSKTDLDDSNHRIIESAKACADSLAASINEMRYFADITSGSMEMIQSEVHPTLLTKSVFAMFTEQVSRKNLQYGITVSRNDFPYATVITDVDKCRQIISAMIEHSIHMTARGRIGVDVSINRKTGVKAEIIISVNDTGDGFKNEENKTIFEPGTNHKHYDGVIGFGLPLAKRFAKSLGGTLRADNTLNGSVIVFSFDADVIYKSDEQKKSLKKVLLVGNNRSADMLFLKIKSNGCLIDKVSNSKQALKAVMDTISNEEDIYDVIIVDTNVNDIPPIEFSAAIRKIPEISGAKFMLSGYIDLNYKHKALSNGYIACVDHSHDIDLSAEMVKSILSPGKFTGYECMPVNTGNKGHGRASVLIVADDETARSISSDLKNGKCNIHVANSAEEMMEISSTVSFSVIIADISLEGVKTATQRMDMRAKMLGLNVPIIAACKELTPEIWNLAMSYKFIDVIDISNAYAIWDSVSQWISADASDAQSSVGRVNSEGNVIMIADGDESTRKTLKKYLEEEGYVVSEACNGSDVITMSNKSMPDMILMDADLPLINGFEVCATIKSSITGAETPIVIITDRNDEASANLAMNAGAVDFIQKPVYLPVLRQRVFNIMRAKNANRKIEHLAYHDRLTNLPNRIRFDEKIEEAIKFANRNKTKIAVMFMDLDRFKNVNDSLGHQAGDILLQQAAERMRQVIHPGDTLARMGGDEFTVLLENIDIDDSEVNSARRVAERIIGVMNERFDINGHPVHVGVSIGIAVSGSDGNNSESLLKNADTALYASKDAGRNKFTFFSASMNEMVAEKIKMEEGLRHAITNNEIVAYYQPQVDVKSGKVIGMEALARWRRSDGSLVSPARFIPVAEESGMIVKIGEMIMTQACENVVEALHDGIVDDQFKIAVNLSAVQFMAPGLTDTVKKVINMTGIPANMLHLEITESLAMRNVDMVKTTLAEIKSLGVGVAMDDFGTGFCSLSYLKMFPIDTLKIDQSFMRGVTSEDAERGDAAIVRAIISMSQAMGITVVAEGVETIDQIEFLKETGADAAQGYLLHKPDNIEVIRQWIVDRNNDTEYLF